MGYGSFELCSFLYRLLPIMLGMNITGCRAALGSGAYPRLALIPAHCPKLLLLWVPTGPEHHRPLLDGEEPASQSSRSSSSTQSVADIIIGAALSRSPQAAGRHVMVASVRNSSEI